MELNEACKTGNLERVKELIAGGADVNIQNNDGYTALIFASAYDYISVVQELILHGAKYESNPLRGYLTLVLGGTNSPEY